MRETTVTACEALIFADRSISPADRNELLARLRAPPGEDAKRGGESPPTRVLRRRDVADRLQKSTRTVDALAQQGILPRVVLPGRRRAIGYLEKDVRALLERRDAPPFASKDATPQEGRPQVEGGVQL